VADDSGGVRGSRSQAWDTSGNVRFKPLSLVFYRQAQSVILVFDVKSLASFQALWEVGGWLQEFKRMTGHTPRTFPFVLVGNKAETDLSHQRQVFEADVREWLSKVGRMPYVETSLTGGPLDTWRDVERVFRTVHRNVARMQESYGRYLPPDTVRTVFEEEFVDEGSFVNVAAKTTSMLESFSKSFSEQSAPAVRRLKDSVQTNAPALVELGEGLHSLAQEAAEWGQRTRDELDKKREELKQTREDLLACGRRSLDKLKRHDPRRPLWQRASPNGKGRAKPEEQVVVQLQEEDDKEEQ